MNECGFWFWFIKPFAGFAALVGACLLYAVWYLFTTWSIDRKKGKSK